MKYLAGTVDIDMSDCAKPVADEQIKGNSIDKIRVFGQKGGRNVVQDQALFSNFTNFVRA